MSLYQKYRPKSLQQVVGNDSVVSSLQGYIENKRVPHSILFHGPTGCGKTTLARIVAKELGCSEKDIEEIDSAQFRGIDTVRKIKQDCMFSPLGGSVKMYVIDECFAKGTPITMQNGQQKAIENIEIGDSVRNLAGAGTVKNVFKNKVSLNRVINIRFENEKNITCSEDHLFLTEQGWKKAKDLKDNFVYLHKGSNFMPNINLVNIQEIEVSNRSRWEGSQYEEKQIKGLKENKEVTPVRVESITFYQQGSNDKPFEGIIGNKERNQGFVEFYDFEVNTHHSYYANGVLVHNCHKMTNDAQNGLLKVLEDTPSHVYFILCTTEPTKLLPTIRGRCSPFQVSTLSDKEMKRLLKRIVKKEKDEVSPKVYKTIIRSGQGHPRNSIQILEQVLNAEEGERQILAEQKEAENSLAIDLARLLREGGSWSEVSKVLKGLKEQDIEGTRRVVLGYISAVLLNKNDPFLGLILEEFVEPFWNSGFPALVLACYRIINAPMEE